MQTMSDNVRRKRAVLMRKAKTNNLKHIAERLGLSVSTVSRVVNNKEYVKEDTRRRVMEALNECNYVPNEIARSLKSKRLRESRQNP